jgi:hypothetical protein
MRIFEKLGFKVKKTTFEKVMDPEVAAKLDAMRARRQTLYRKDSMETAALYADWLPTTLFDTLLAVHDYQCVMWGSRKFGRLLNLCRNILDIEVHKENAVLTKDDNESVLKLLFWICLLYPIPIKHYLKCKDVEGKWRPQFEQWLSSAGVLTEDEISLVMHGVFEGVDADAGNPVLDIFHDALRIEEIQFDIQPCPKEWMRTELGANPVFLVKARKDSLGNVSPAWLELLQVHKKSEAFVDVILAKERREVMEDDGIM